MHESGEWLETEPLVMRPVKNDPQGMGSCITYARRYSYSALLSISTDEDDDGHSASQAPKGSYNNSNNQPSNNSNNLPTTATQANNASEVMYATDPQVKMLRAKMAAAGFGNDLTKVNKFLEMELTSITELPRSKVNDLIKYLDEQRLPA